MNGVILLDSLEVAGGRVALDRPILVVPELPATLPEFRDFIEAARRKAKEWIIVLTGSLSAYGAGKLGEELLGGVAYVSAAHVYLALATTLPDDTTTGTTIVETDYASYARTEIGTGNNQTDAFNAATGTTTKTITNKNAITCPTATGPSTNPITGVAITDASTVGNILGWASVTSTAIANGDTPKVNASALSAVFD